MLLCVSILTAAEMEQNEKLLCIGRIKDIYEFGVEAGPNLTETLSDNATKPEGTPDISVTTKPEETQNPRGGDVNGNQTPESGNGSMNNVTTTSKGIALSRVFSLLILISFSCLF